MYASQNDGRRSNSNNALNEVITFFKVTLSLSEVMAIFKNLTCTFTYILRSELLGACIPLMEQTFNNDPILPPLVIILYGDSIRRKSF